MAVFIPPKRVIATRSAAESKVIEWLSRLPDTYTVLHSIGILNHPFKNWAEADVVIVGPQGILVIEVKGGRVQRKNGLWGFTRADNETTWKTEGPYEQAGGASAALRTRLLELGAIKQTTCFGFGVILTDCSAPKGNSSFLTEVTQDANSSWQSPTYTLNSWSEFWAGKQGNDDGLDEPERRAVVQEMRGDLDLLPMLALEVGSAEEQLTRATDEQAKVLASLATVERLVIKGGAGTGKTLLALNEALRLANQDARVLVLCSSRHLAKGLREAVSNADLRIRPAFHSVEESGNLNTRFDALIVDEAQDLAMEDFEKAFGSLLEGGIENGRWRIFLDPDQAVIQPLDLRVEELLSKHAVAVVPLSMNCRNTGQISAKASMLSRIPIGSGGTVSGPDVHQDWCRDAAIHEEFLAEELLRVSGALSSDRITLLSRTGFAESRIAALKQATNLGFSALGEPRDGRVRFARTADFKGFDDEAIVIADIDDLSSDDGRKQLYVACTRARAHLSLLLYDNVKNDYQEAGQWMSQELAGKLQSKPTVAPVTRIG